MLRLPHQSRPTTPPSRGSAGRPARVLLIGGPSKAGKVILAALNLARRARRGADDQLDLTISTTGVLTRQHLLDGAPGMAGTLIQANCTSHVTVLLAIGSQLRKSGRGTVVILSSVAAHGVLLVHPGFVVGKTTYGGYLGTSGGSFARSRDALDAATAVTTTAQIGESSASACR